MNKDEIKAEFDYFAGFYDDTVINELKYTAFKLVPRNLERHLKSTSMHILDLGCGTGLSGEYLIKKNHYLYGVDLSENMLKIAKHRGYKDLTVADIETFSFFKNMLFDSAISLGLTEFISNINIFFDNVSKKLKDNGIFAVTFPTNKLPAESGHDIKLYTRTEIKNAYTDRKFDLIEEDILKGYEIEGFTVNYALYILKKHS